MIDHDHGMSEKRRLVRELDVIWNGSGAAGQASLCDMVAQIRNELPKLRAISQATKEDWARRIAEFVASKYAGGRWYEEVLALMTNEED